MKFLRTIRFDETDTRVYPLAAEAGEWSLPGGFEFAQSKPGELTGKAKQAFANGFLGLGTFGRSTFATVSETTAVELALIETLVARHFMERYGAPDETQAQAAARDEIAFVSELCASASINTVLTVRRRFDENGQIREEFRVITPPSGEAAHTRIWKVETDDN